MSKKPNIVFVFGDQCRQQATGYVGDPNVNTPNLDALASYIAERSCSGSYTEQANHFQVALSATFCGHRDEG